MKEIVKKLWFLAIPVLTLLNCSAQSYVTSGDIYLGLKKLNVLGSVLYIAAHPDDENTRLITYFSKDRLYRTGYMSLTRGDGGQNLIGDEQGIELGLIRTQELLAARRIDGGEQFFSRAFDFGFSKTPDETFTKWDREKILSDVVWVIRKFQPDVIITRFPTTGEGGHGHHTASAILANEAFTAAADPNRFPEQLKFVKTWQAKRIFFNVFNFSGNATQPEGSVKIDVGGYNPVLGKSYGEIAAESRSQHKTQGFGSSGNRGEQFEYFKLTGGDAPAGDLFDGVDISWNKAGAPAVTKAIDKITSAFDFLHPESSVKDLVRLYKMIDALPASQWKSQKLNEVSRLVEACSGLYVDATTTVPFVAQTDSVQINLVLNNRLGSEAVLQKINVDGYDSVLNSRLVKNKNLMISKALYVAETKSVTQPYWLVNEMKEGYYNVSDQQLIGIPDMEPAYIVTFTVRIEGQDFQIARKVRYKFNDPVKGEVYEPFVVVAPVSITKEPHISVVKYGGNTDVDFHVRAYKNIPQSNFQGEFVIHDELGHANVYTNLPSKLVRGFDKTISFPLDSIISERGGIINYEQFVADVKSSNGTVLNKTVSNSWNYSGGFKIIQYDHIPKIIVPVKSLYLIRPVNVSTVGKKIGYIVGAGDKVPETLEQMGYDVTLLTDKELSRNNLQQFDAIIAGVRAYNTNEWLNSYYEKLMKYVESGGNLIVQYNTSNNIGPVRAKIGPYEFEITRNRITNENAAVTFVDPNHQVLNYPNKITQDDFIGWIQERSIYHAGRRDTAFHSIFKMNDPNEQADDGSLVIAKYGKGYFTYTGLVFFRELPAGVPGAYRLIANLIALNHKKEF